MLVTVIAYLVAGAIWYLNHRERRRHGRTDRTEDNNTGQPKDYVEDKVPSMPWPDDSAIPPINNHVASADKPKRAVRTKKVYVHRA